MQKPEDLQHPILFGLKASTYLFFTWLLGACPLYLGVRSLVPNLWRGRSASAITRVQNALDSLIANDNAKAFYHLKAAYDAELDVLYAMRGARRWLILALLIYYIAVASALAGYLSISL